MIGVFAVSVSFNKFKICPSWYGPDSDDEPTEIDDENRAIDSFEVGRKNLCITYIEIKRKL